MLVTCSSYWYISGKHSACQCAEAEKNGRHFPDDIFKCIFFNENVWILIKISLEFAPRGPINNIPSLVQIMAWRRPGNKPLSEPMIVSLLTHICVTRPQWVKLIAGILCIIRQTTIYIYHNGKIFHDPQTGYFACSFFKWQKQNVASDCEVTPHTSQWEVLHNHGTPSIFFSFVLKQGHIYKCKIQATHHLTSRSRDLISATPLSWQSHQIGMEWT